MLNDTDDVADIDEVDADALRRAMEIARRDPGRAEQLDSMLTDQPWEKARPWLEVATFAAYCVQCRALHLKPWEGPPCHLHEEGEVRDCDREGQVLLRRMLKAGLSRWEPDPMAALAAKAKRKTPKSKPKKPKQLRVA